MSEPLGEPRPSSLDRLGERAQRRPEPRTSISLAGAGCALGVLGTLVLAGDTGLDDETGDFRQIPGLLRTALVIALGYVRLSAVREGPRASAGTVAAALGVPAFMFFVTFDDGGGYPPFNTEAILIVSTVVWLGSYVVGAARGRPFFLGSGLVALWLTVLELTENILEWNPFAFWFGGFETSSSFDSSGEITSEGEIIGGTGDFSGPFDAPRFETPDPFTIGMLSLGFGVAFLFLARWCDRTGRHGTGTPFSVAALPCLAVGVFGLAPDLEAAGSGLLLAAIGLALAWHGATVRRRATSWIGGATMALGLAIFLGDMSGDIATTGGMLFIAGGIAMVFLGHLLRAALDEPDELAVTYGVRVANGPMRQVVPSAPIPPPPGAPDPGTGPDAEWRPPPPPAAPAAPAAPADPGDDPPPPPA